MINNRQKVTINDITFQGAQSYSSIPIVQVIGPNSMFIMKGNASITKSQVNDVVFLDQSATLIMRENSSLLNNYASAVYVRSQSNLIMEDNAFIRAMDFSVELSDFSSFIMKDNATVSGVNGMLNSIIISGGSEFSMYGGIISDNNGYAGVTIRSSSVFNMYGGMITGNSSLAGGGVSVTMYSIFNMYGGVIKNNDALYYDGGIYVGHASTFTMYGGTIYGSEESGIPTDLANAAYDFGSALYVGGLGAKALYGDNVNILPHIDGFDDYTDFTISVPTASRR